MPPWKLAETNYGEVKQRRYEVAVLPFGATEPHNLHLPYGTDTFECEVIGDRVCEEADRRGAKVILLPTIPYGTQTNQMKFPFAMNFDPTTLATMVGNLVESLVHTGIRKVVLFNGHGGNDLKWVLRQLYGRTPAHLFLCNWYTVCNDIYHEVFTEADSHAGEMETSLALACFPEFVVRKPDGSLTADEGRPAATRFEAVNRGWVSITRPWHLLTTNAGAGNPHAATVDKGRRLIETLVERLAQFLVELSAAPVDERFPY
jgi:creatinine amidohydrolase